MDEKQKTRQEILASAGIYEIELDEKRQAELDKINNEYGKLVEEKYQKRMKKYGAAQRKNRHFIIKEQLIASSYC